MNGIGGSGKTTFFLNLIPLIKQIGLSYVVVAPTANAREIYKEQATDINAWTIHSFFGIHYG